MWIIFLIEINIMPFIIPIIIGVSAVSSGAAAWFKYNNKSKKNSKRGAKPSPVSNTTTTQETCIVQISSDTSVKPQPQIQLIRYHKLPDEIMDYIGQYLQSSTDFISFARTNRWFFRYYRIKIEQVHLMAQRFSSNQNLCYFNRVSETHIPGHFLETKMSLPAGFRPKTPNSIPFWNLVNSSPKWNAYVKDIYKSPSKFEATSQWITTLISFDPTTAHIIKGILFTLATAIGIFNFAHFENLMLEKYPWEYVTVWDDEVHAFVKKIHFLVEWSAADKYQEIADLLQIPLSCFEFSAFLQEPRTQQIISLLTITISCLLSTQTPNLIANILRFTAHNLIIDRDNSQSRTTDKTAFNISEQRYTFFNTSPNPNLSIKPTIDRNFALN